MNTAEARAALAEVIVRTAPEELEDALLVGFVVIVEWQDRRGGVWLSRLDGDGIDPERCLPTWRRQGYLHNGLHEHWPGDPDDEVEDTGNDW